MNREKIIQILNEYAVDLFAHGLRYGYETNTPLLEKIADEIVSSLPPAEGAEQRIRVRNILQDFYRRGEYELEQAEEDIMRLFQPQPTAEGAEEIFTELEFVKLLVDNTSGKLDDFEFRKIVNKRANDFATLHAQRIAEKMVSERLREELIRYIKWYGGFNYEDMTDEMLVNEYLKSR